MSESSRVFEVDGERWRIETVGPGLHILRKAEASPPSGEVWREPSWSGGATERGVRRNFCGQDLTVNSGERSAQFR